MALGPRVPQRGEVYSLDPNPTLGKEMRDRHYWLVLTEEAVNRHGMVVAVVINTVAEGMRKAGLAVQVSAGAVNGVAVINQVRSFDFRARDQEGGGVTYEGTADAAIVADIAARVASLIDPEPPPSPQPRGRGKAKEASAIEGSLGAVLKEAFASQGGGASAEEASAKKKDPQSGRKK
jgi:mRNA interferase ChpB